MTRWLYDSVPIYRLRAYQNPYKTPEPPRWMKMIHSLAGISSRWKKSSNGRSC